MIRSSLKVGLVGVGLVAATACDYDGSFLFADVADIPPVVHIDGEDGEYVVPAAIVTADEIPGATIYAEVGAPASAAPGGVTLNFKGTGGDVCVWVDPEMAFWNQKVGSNPSAQGAPWTYPDNIFDDGDLDLFVGLSAYYTGSPGEAMGDFVVSYEDSLGNEIPIELTACSNRGFDNIPNAHAGRGMAEYCSVRATDLDISYTIALQTWSAPLDDDRLGFGILVYDGHCDDLKSIAGAGDLIREECVITGEGIQPNGEDHGPWYGYDESRTWGGSENFEAAFCAEEMADYCEAEAEAVAEDGEFCAWNALDEGGARCFCGDPNDTPQAGAG